nr:hypothetical protein [Candidatus Sigynarchaeum springense]
MKYILHQCNSARRLQQGLTDLRFDGVEIDFLINKGNIIIGHNIIGGIPNADLSIQSIGNCWRDILKILVVDIKGADIWPNWSTDEGVYLLDNIAYCLPYQIPIFITGFSFDLDWIQLIDKTIDIWNGRHVTYFVDAQSIAHCQDTYQRKGIKFGLNYGHPTTGLRRIMTEALPKLLQERAENNAKQVGKMLEDTFRPLNELEQIAWKCADVRMAWTASSEATTRELTKLKPDYLIVEGIPGIDSPQTSAKKDEG